MFRALARMLMARPWLRVILALGLLIVSAAIDEQSMEIKLTSGRGYQKLTADIPIVGPRDGQPMRKRK